MKPENESEGMSPYPEIYVHTPNAQSHLRELCVTKEDYDALRSRLDEALRELERVRETKLDEALSQIMAATEDQINAALKLEGRDPNDVSTIGKQCAEIALLRVKLESAEREKAELIQALRELDDFIELNMTEMRDPGSRLKFYEGLNLHRGKARALLARLAPAVHTAQNSGQSVISQRQER